MLQFSSWNANAVHTHSHVMHGLMLRLFSKDGANTKLCIVAHF